LAPADHRAVEPFCAFDGNGLIIFRVIISDEIGNWTSLLDSIELITEFDG